MGIITFKKKDKQESYENTTICYICIEKFDNKHVKDKKYCKIRSHCHYTGEYREAAHIICNLKYSELKKIPIAFHNGSNYDYHFIIKELAEEIQEQITCLGEITTIDKNGEEITKQISYVLQFIKSAKFMASSLSNLVNNLSEGIHKIKCKYRHNDKKCETCEIRYKYCDGFLNRQTLKMI